MIIDQPEKCSWFPFSDEPLLNSKIYAPKFCDPCLIMPEDSCDGKWHMFVHSWIGIHHFVSNSGIAWEPDRVVEFRGHSPFIFRDKENYYLLYEIHEKNLPLLNSQRVDRQNESSSRIEMRTSTDLVTWSKPRLLIDSRNVPSAKDYVPTPRVSRPQLFVVNGRFRLYFGSSDITMPDINQKVSRYLAYAEAEDINGPYLVKHNAPILESDPDDRWTNLGTGSIKIIQADDKYYAFQCGVYWDEAEKHTHSALILLESNDGITFKRVKKTPILTHTTAGWASSYIMSCDVHYRAEEKCWYCYYSANNGKKRITNESIGLMIGTMPQPSKKVSVLKVPGTFLP